MESEDTINLDDSRDSRDSRDSDHSDDTVDTMELKEGNGSTRRLNNDLKDGVYSQIPMPFNMDIIAKTPIATVEEADEPSETSEHGIETAPFPICSLQTQNLMETDPDPNHLSAAPVLLESHRSGSQHLVGSLRLSITASPARTPNPLDTPTPRSGGHLSLSPGPSMCISPNVDSNVSMDIPDIERSSNSSVRSLHSDADMEAMEETLHSFVNRKGSDHIYGKSKSTVLSTTETSPMRRDNGKNCHSRKLTDLLSGRSIHSVDYSPVGRGYDRKNRRKFSKLKSSTNSHNNSISTDPRDRMQSMDTLDGFGGVIGEGKESRKCSILHTLFGNKQMMGDDAKHHRIDSKRSAFSSMRELSENFSSKMRRKDKGGDCRSFSKRINFAVIQDLIDIELHSDITSCVHPLTHEFIPIPESFYDATVDEAAKHIFKHFIASSAPYAINISYESRSYLRGLLCGGGGGSRRNTPRGAASTRRTTPRGGLSEMSDLTKIFLFDSAFCEIYQTVASDSFLRFKSSLKFREWLKEGHLTRVPKVRQRRHHKEESQWSFNASFVDFNTTLYYEKRKEDERREDEIIQRGVVLKALPSGQTVDAVEALRNEK